MRATTARPARLRWALQRCALLAVAVALVGGTLGTGVASASDVDAAPQVDVGDSSGGTSGDPDTSDPTGPGDDSTPPVTSDPDQPGPEVTYPAPTEPGPIVTGPSNPGPSGPGPSGPDATDSGPTDPGPTDPGPTDPGPTESEPTGPESDDTGDVPGTPRDLTVTLLEDGTVVIGWRAPAAEGSSPVTGYSVRVDGSNAVTTGPEDRTARFTRLPAGDHVAFVAASNSAGPGQSRSIVLSIPVPVVVAPSAPTSVTATQTIDGQLTLTWDEPADPGSAAVEAYEVAVRDVGAVAAGASGRGLRDGSDTRTYPADARSAVLVGLLPERTYTLTVAARSDAGVGAAVGLRRVVERLEVPSAPRDLALAQSAPGQLTLTFEAPLDTGSSEVSEYVVSVAGPDGPSITWHGADTRLVVVDDLGAGAYDVRVRAINDSGPGTPVQSRGTVLADWTLPDLATGPADVAADPVEPELGAVAEREPLVAIRVAPVVDVQPAPGGNGPDGSPAVASPPAVAATESGGISLFVLLLLGAAVAMAATRLGGGEEEL